MKKNPVITQLNIFGNSEIVETARTRQEIHADYEGFVDKFKPKKTTDDCYTPQDVYDAIRGWVNDNVLPLDGLDVVRPFRPGGDYQADAESYGPQTFVLDNPPFSILAQIRRFYNSRGIGYFLFGPSLTLVSVQCEGVRETFIVAGADIVYENGATVKTGFITNRWQTDTVMTVRGDLHHLIEKTQAARPRKNAAIPVYRYPAHVISAAIMQKLAARGLILDIPRAEAHFIRTLDSQRSAKKSIFGNGFLISERLAAERLAAERLAAERLADERLADERLADERLAERENIEWELSEREREIIRELDRHSPQKND